MMTRSWLMAYIYALGSVLLLRDAALFINLPPETTLLSPIVPMPYNIKRSAQIAQAKLQASRIRRTPDQRRDRLAVMVVFNYPMESNGTHPRMGSLVCALNKVYENVAPHTPVDVYVWFNESAINNIPKWFKLTFPEAIIMPIDPLSWQMPEGLSPMDVWTYGNTFSADYHLMGRWRLTFAFDFVKALGYQYMLQMDDDTFVVAPMKLNIVKDFRERQIAYALRDRISVEEHVVVLGLPELVKYWMSSRNYLAPQGPLLSHFASGDVSGVHGEGWDRHIASASFMIFDVGFWFEPAVQDLLHLAYATGGDLMQRWLEQGLQNMLHLLFLPDRHVHRFSAGAAIHTKIRDAAVLALLKCDRVVLAPTGVTEQLPPQPQVLGLQGVTAPRPPPPAELRTIEFLVLWHVTAPGRNAEELTLFRWRYNTSSCGADTPILNNYAEYATTPYRVDPPLNIDPDKWFKYGMDARLAALRDTSRIVVSQQAPGPGCRELLREQLRQFVEFYCIGYGTDRHETTLNEMCNLLWTQAAAALDTQTAAAGMYGVEGG